MKAHASADLFPMLDEHELDALVEDIRARGLVTPIVTYRGEILDGRNRLRACERAGVQPRFQEYRGDDPVGTAIALNVARRTLTDSQRALIAAGLRHMFAEGSSDERRRANLKRGDVRSQTVASSELAATMLRVPVRTVERAAALLRDGAPELVEAVRRGEVSISAASSVARLPADEQAEVLQGGDVVDTAKRLRARKGTGDSIVVAATAAAQIRRKLASIRSEIDDACVDSKVRKLLEDEFANAARFFFGLTEEPQS